MKRLAVTAVPGRASASVGDAGSEAGGSKLVIAEQPLKTTNPLAIKTRTFISVFTGAPFLYLPFHLSYTLFLTN